MPCLLSNMTFCSFKPAKLKSEINGRTNIGLKYSACQMLEPTYFVLISTLIARRMIYEPLSFSLRNWLTLYLKLSLMNKSKTRVGKTSSPWSPFELNCEPRSCFLATIASSGPWLIDGRRKTVNHFCTNNSRPGTFPGTWVKKSNYKYTRYIIKRT